MYRREETKKNKIKVFITVRNKENIFLINKKKYFTKY